MNSRKIHLILYGGSSILYVDTQTSGYLSSEPCLGCSYSRDALPIFCIPKPSKEKARLTGDGTGSLKAVIYAVTEEMPLISEILPVQRS